jgi:hypothetical protein
MQLRKVLYMFAQAIVNILQGFDPHSFANAVLNILSRFLSGGGANVHHSARRDVVFFEEV